MVNGSLTSFPDTIHALGSGSLPSGIAIIRISGPHTQPVLEEIAGGVPQPRHAELRMLRRGSEVLDRALVLYFPAPASFTGEDTAEFHVHGGRAVVQGVLDALNAIDGCRPAEAGEFTRRAFLNGKIDLTGAEALADLIGAETEAQRRFAMSGVAGAYRDLYSGWQTRMTRARALIEADLDFSDEQDVPGSVTEAVWEELAALSYEIGAHLDGARVGEIIREGYNVVLIGAPNSGKSSLLNCLARRDVAIVTEEAGTTRDLIDVALDMDGCKVIVTDTAGVRESGSAAEKIGIQRAIERSSTADLVLLLTDISSPIQVSRSVTAKDVLRIGTKADLGSEASKDEDYDLVISSVTGAGISALLEAIGKRAISSTASGSLVPARKRHIELLNRSRRFLDEAISGQDDSIELRAELLRNAANALGRITGTVEVDELLDVIFSEFCIGK